MRRGLPTMRGLLRRTAGAARAARRLAASPFAPPRPFLGHDQYAPDLERGEWTYGEPTVHWAKPGRKLRIGRFCSIASGVTIMMGGNHHSDWVSTFPFAEVVPAGEGEPPLPWHETTGGDVTIGHDVWICEDVLILSGVTIGSGAILGARSVVARDVAPYSIVAGNPAVHRRYRVEEALIDDLLALAWWDWPIGRIREARPHLLSGDVRGFLERYRSFLPPNRAGVVPANARREG